MGLRSINEGESGGLRANDQPGRRRGASVSGGPATDQAITIGGAPARLLRMHCPPGSGFLVETAVTIHHGTAFVFASQTRRGRQPATAPPSANSWPVCGFSGKGSPNIE
jgi:hypothetical protein